MGFVGVQPFCFLSNQRFVVPDCVFRRAIMGTKTENKSIKTTEPENSSTSLVSVSMVVDAAVNVDSVRITVDVDFVLCVVVAVCDA